MDGVVVFFDEVLVGGVIECMDRDVDSSIEKIVKCIWDD